jgi:8-oxo-dGTP pyrophosphatase MutT (NUDIX family)
MSTPKAGRLPYDAAMPDSPPPGVSPIVRNAARIVLLDERDRLLLFLWDDERLDVRRIWITPGGGLDAGESFEQAARRELWEETGMEADPGPCVWQRRHVLRVGKRWIDQRERYFLTRVPRIDVDRANHTALERTAMLDHRLWSIDEIAASREWFAPRRLAELLPPLLRGDLPGEPIDVGV